MPGTFEMEWPPGSGRVQEFPELDRVAWFGRSAAAELMIPAQQEFLPLLLSAVD